MIIFTEGVSRLMLELLLSGDGRDFALLFSGLLCRARLKGVVGKMMTWMVSAGGFQIGSSVCSKVKEEVEE